MYPLEIVLLGRQIELRDDKSAPLRKLLPTVASASYTKVSHDSELRSAEAIKLEPTDANELAGKEISINQLSEAFCKKPHAAVARDPTGKSRLVRAGASNPYMKL